MTKDPSGRGRTDGARLDRVGVLHLAAALVVTCALPYGFSRLTGELDERAGFPLGTPALVVGLALTLWAP